MEQVKAERVTVYGKCPICNRYCAVETQCMTAWTEACEHYTGVIIDSDGEIALNFINKKLDKE